MELSEPSVAPEYSLSKTLNHPFDPAKVMGFEGRNRIFGIGAVVLKAEAVPRDEFLPMGTVVLPHEVEENVLEDGWEVVLLCEDAVFSIDGGTFEGLAKPHTFDVGDSRETLLTLHCSEMDGMPRSCVTFD